LDTSSDGAKSYVADVFLKERLKFGDTFHLIAFSDTSRLVTMQKIMGNADLESVRGQALALSPAMAEPDVRQALAFAQTYVASLSTARQKKVTLVSSADIPQPSETSAAFNKVDAVFDQIKPPRVTSPPVTPSQPSAPASQPSVTPQLPTTQQPKPAQSQPTAPQPKAQVPPATAPQQAAQPSAPPASSPESPQDGPLSAFPQAPPDTPQAKEPEKAPTPRPPKIVTPQAPPEQAVRVVPKPSHVLMPPPRALNLLFVVCFFLAFFLLWMMRRTLRSVNRAFALVSTDFDGPMLLSLFVEDQNTNIGRRNIHILAKGVSLGLGGGKSDFLIFLVPLPQNIAKVRFDGGHCSFVPRKKGFFPEITTETLPDCIGETIKIRSERNYELFIRIIRHEDPLVVLNRLFLSVKLPGR
jgi:hypothetical protein